jgi:hypothetical protein
MRGGEENGRQGRRQIEKRRKKDGIGDHYHFYSALYFFFVG